MAYDKQTWVLGIAGGTALNATRLNHMEQGIEDAHTLIADLATASHTHTSDEITDATSANVVDTIVKRDATGFIAVSGITGLSTATGNTQAVPKSQLDAAIAALAATSHTHTVDQVTNISTVGAQVATAATAEDARDALDVDSTTSVDTKTAAATATAATDATTKADAAQSAAAAYTDTAVDYAPIHRAFAVGSIPTRPNTSGTNRKVWWTGPAAAGLPTDGTAAGGTAAAAPGDIILEH